MGPVWLVNLVSPAFRSSGGTPAATPKLVHYRDDDGIALAISIIALWASTVSYALCSWNLAMRPWWASALLVVALEYVYSALFVTGHDAWHGSVSRRHPRINRLIGQVALTCHGWFDFDHLAQIHRCHHAHHGIPGQDPDLHPGSRRMLPWFIAMAFDYATPMQLLYISTELLVLIMVVKVPLGNLLLFMLLPMAMSTFRLFFFLTYIPHKPQGWEEFGLPSREIRSFQGPSVIATLLCFNAVYHEEHHRAPHLPWFVLPQAVAA